MVSDVAGPPMVQLLRSMHAASRNANNVLILFRFIVNLLFFIFSIGSIGIIAEFSPDCNRFFIFSSKIVKFLDFYRFFEKSFRKFCEILVIFIF